MRPLLADRAFPAAPVAEGPAEVERFCDLAREIVSAMLDVPVAEINRPSRSVAPTCRARHVAIYLANVVFQVPLAVIASEFGRDRTSVGHAIRRIEDERDSADFDSLVSRLERLAAVCRRHVEAVGRPSQDAQGGADA